MNVKFCGSAGRAVLALVISLLVNLVPARYALGSDESWTDVESVRILAAPDTEAMHIFTVGVPAENELLRQTAEEVPQAAFEEGEPGRVLQSLIARMLVTVKAARGIGIAGPQVGISRRIFLARRLDRMGDVWEAFINPHLSELSQEMVVGQEGCLSVPGKKGAVARHRALEISYRDVHGKDFVGVKFEDAASVPPVGMARLIQHEYDHLDGVVYIDILAHGFVEAMFDLSQSGGF